MSHHNEILKIINNLLSPTIMVKIWLFAGYFSDIADPVVNPTYQISVRFSSNEFVINSFAHLNDECAIWEKFVTKISVWSLFTSKLIIKITGITSVLHIVVRDETPRMIFIIY